jgi:hypothetical protein
MILNNTENGEDFALQNLVGATLALEEEQNWDLQDLLHGDVFFPGAADSPQIAQRWVRLAKPQEDSGDPAPQLQVSFGPVP